MAKKADKKKAEIPGPKAAAPAPVQIDVDGSILSLAQRVNELEGDIKRMAKLCGDVWGEPLASEAMRIATKVQG